MISQSIPQANEDHARRERADYGFARLRDQMFDAVTALWRRRKAEGLAQKELAARIGRDPAWVSRSLAAPGNWTLRTAGELIQALEGEAEIRVAALEDPLESRPNYDAYASYSDLSAETMAVAPYATEENPASRVAAEWQRLIAVPPPSLGQDSVSSPNTTLQFNIAA